MAERGTPPSHWNTISVSLRVTIMSHFAPPRQAFGDQPIKFALSKPEPVTVKVSGSVVVMEVTDGEVAIRALTLQPAPKSVQVKVVPSTMSSSSSVS